MGAVLWPGVPLMSAKRKRGVDNALVTNRKARHEYQILETFEAGVVLQGTEVKSIRTGHVSLNESYARLEDGELFLHGCHINPYEYGNRENHESLRPKKLLLHKAELRKLYGKAAVKGCALIPLRLYLKRNRVKVELALCRGKQVRDKREDIKRKTADREARRAMARGGA
jgi:SsrA-binding protein